MPILLTTSSMPEIDLTITISAIVALAAVISPILTALINNHHQLKLKRLELKQQEYERTIMYKRYIFENFIMSLSMVAQLHTTENIDSFAKWYPLAYMYLPEEVQNTLAEINLLVARMDWSEIVKYVDLITSDINKELQKL